MKSIPAALLLVGCCTTWRGAPSADLQTQPVESAPDSPAVSAATADQSRGEESVEPRPEPSPVRLEEPLQSEPSDPMELLWSHRLNFAAGGEPLVTVRLMEGQGEIVFSARNAGRIRPRGGPPIEVAAGRVYRVRARDALPAALAHYPLLVEVPFRDRAALAAAQKKWEESGLQVRQRIVGGVYGIAGRVIDNRRQLLLADGDGSEGWAEQVAREVRARTGEQPAIFRELVTRPAGQLEVFGPDGVLVGTASVALSLEVEKNAGFILNNTEHDLGTASHGFEDRAYPGRLFVTVDAKGGLAAVNAIALEELLRGLVPSEMPAKAPTEALKAQAVTARSNVLAQIGTRHLTDPYVLCSEVHCQSYKGGMAHTASTDKAVRATKGRALFGKKDRTLVDAVYSAVCGGHGEDNDAVWGGLPSSSLRGRPDLPAKEASTWAGGLRDESRLRSFLSPAPASYCSHLRNYRWERRLDSAALAAATSALGTGQVISLEVTSRGVSGRARTIRIRGEQATVEVDGELRIRRLLGNLPSAMFVVDREGADLVLRGGGWGHGAGMCQWGAVGRARAGQGYREILRAYYSGAEVAKIY